MALMYHLTGEGKYVQAIKRAGDWLVRAQGEDIPLWADQYDSEDRPAWARAFEPPAYGASGTKYACQALREIYRFSGDERYLEPIRRSVDWMAENLAEGEMAAYIEPGTGRPIAGWVAEGKPGQVYYLDDPEDVAYLETVPIGRWCLEQGPMLGPIQAILDSAADPDAALPPEVTVEGAMELRPPYASTQTASGWRAFVQSFLDSQNEAGVWVSPNTGRHLGEGFQSDPYYVRHLLYYIEHARIALGEIEPMYRGGGNLLKMAYPYADWYEVNWEVNTE